VLSREESLMAKIVVLGDKKNISGEIKRSVAMILNPDSLRVLDAFNER